MKTNILSAAVALAASFNVNADAWETCRDNVSSWMWAQGWCGASGCGDDDGRMLEDYVIEECGLKPWTKAERAALIKKASAECRITKQRLNCPMSISSDLKMFKKSEPIHGQILDSLH
jgi:hypothetical protein